MNQKTTWIDAINQLIRINYDRISDYEKAMLDIEDEYLVTIFNHNASLGRFNVHGLRQLILSLQGEPVMDAVSRNKLLQVWMDFKASLFGKDLKTLLSNVEFKELQVIQAYDEALKMHADFPYRIRSILQKQRQTLRNALYSILDISLVSAGDDHLINH